MKQPVTQKKLIINNRKFGYFITLLKIKFLASQLASKKNPYLHKCYILDSIIRLRTAPGFTYIHVHHDSGHVDVEDFK